MDNSKQAAAPKVGEWWQLRESGAIVPIIEVDKKHVTITNSVDGARCCVNRMFLACRVAPPETHRIAELAKGGK